MSKITLVEFESATKNTRNRENVASKLEAHLAQILTDAQANEAHKIAVSDFTDVADAHYYSSLKMLKEKFADVIDFRFILKENGRFENLYIKVK